MTNPLIGSLLQERQEVIARIAQRLNFCDPTAPPIPPALFTPDTPPKAFWGSSHDDTTLRKTKEPEAPPPEPTGHEHPSPFDTPVSDPSLGKRETLSPKPVACRKLRMGETGERDKDREMEKSLISQAVQDISRLIQDRLSVPSLSPTHGRSGSPLLHTHTQTVTHTIRTYTYTTHAVPDAGCSQSNGFSNGHTASRRDTHTTTHAPVCTDKSRTDPEVELSVRAQNGTSITLEDPPVSLQPQTPPCLQTFPPEEPGARTPSPPDNPLLRENGLRTRPTCTEIQSPSKPQTQSQTQSQFTALQDENQAPPGSGASNPATPTTRSPSTPAVLRTHSPSPLRPCNSWRKQNRRSLDSTATKAFHPCTGLPLLSSPVPQRKTQTGYFDLDSSLIGCKGLPWASGKRVCLKREDDTEEAPQLFSASAPPASLSLLGNFEECVLNHRLEPLGTIEGFTAEVGASGTFCPSHMTFPVDVSFYSVSEDNAPSPYMGVITLESLGKRGYRVPPSGTIQVTLFNPNKTVVKMFVVVYDLRAMPAGHQTFLRQRTFSVPVRRDGTHTHTSRKPLPLGQGRTLRYLVHLRFQSSKSGKIYLHRDIRLLFSRKSMEVDSGAAYELQSFTDSPADPPFSPRC